MLTFITYAIILFFIEVAYIAIARRFNIIATTTNKISESRQPIITGGGILFFIATVIFFIFKNDGDRYFMSMPWTVFAALAMLTVVSFIDDGSYFFIIEALVQGRGRFSCSKHKER